MGVVYKARDTRLERLVALKFLPPHLSADPEAKTRLIHEAKAASALDQSNIATIYEIAETENGQLFIAMAYYDGETLKEKLAGGPLPPSKALDYTLQLTQGLSRAHEAGIIHRDIKPANIMITGRDVVKLLDFGVAKMEDVSTLTRPGTTPGTVAYMSPEQTRGEHLDARTDVWSLGVVVYEMLSGERPFQGENTDVIIYGIRHDEPRSLSDLCPETPRLLAQVLERMIVKERDGRFDSASEILADLKSGQSRWRPEAVAAVPEPVSVVLLPLVSMTRDAEQEWFTDGMTDALTTDMAKIGGLRIISLASAMHYKGTKKRPPEIAGELGVDYVVEGTVAKLENDVKISARLIHAVQDEYLWAERYERPFKDILGLQAEIARTIAGQIRVELTPQEEQLLDIDRSVAPEIHELYLKGMYHINRYTPESIELGFNYLHRAVDEDPNEPFAHAGLAVAYGILSHTPAPPPDALQKARAYAEKALALDENLAEAYQGLSMTQVFEEWDVHAGIASIDRALEINPSLAMGHALRSFYISLKKRPGYDLSETQVDEHLAECWAEFATAQRLDPLEPLYSAWHSEAIFCEGGPLDKSIGEAKKALELNPDMPIALHALGWAYNGKGMFEEAIATNKRAGEVSRDYRWCLGETYALAGEVDAALEIAAELEAQPQVFDSYGLARIYNALGETDRVFHWLEEGYRQHHPYMLWFQRPNNFGNLRDDPRFEDLSRRLNLVY
jgi:TolB-like protein